MSIESINKNAELFTLREFMCNSTNLILQKWCLPSSVTQIGNLTLRCHLKEVYNPACLPKLSNIFTAFSSISFTWVLSSALYWTILTLSVALCTVSSKLSRVAWLSPLLWPISNNVPNIVVSSPSFWTQGSLSPFGTKCFIALWCSKCRTLYDYALLLCSSHLNSIFAGICGHLIIVPKG